jgi:hypothetical protein
MKFDISHVTTGLKSALLELLAAFFEKHNAGAVIPIAVTAVPMDTKSLKISFIRSNACLHLDHYCEAYSQFDQWSGCLTRHQHPIQFHRSAAPQAP